jgi:hypothetical protein
MAVEFELLEGRIHGARYYTVKPLFDWWLPGGITGNNWRVLIEWCEGNFGPIAESGVWEPNGRWYANNAKFWFRDENDRTLFLLRWA